MPPSSARPPVSAQSSSGALRRALDLASDPTVQVVSFDVFDTLLFRQVPDPVDAFELLGARLRDANLLRDHVDPQGFRDLRVAAEARARHLRAADGDLEVDLEEVYGLLLGAHVLATDAHVADLVEAEVGLEDSLLVPDLDVAGVLATAREHGKRCIAVSDTYFTHGQVVRLLDTRVDPLDEVFVSSAHRVGKGSGLWPIVLDALGVEPAAVFHLGDNEHADVHEPKGLGIRPVLLERRPPSLEVILERERRHAALAVPEAGGDFGLTALRAKTLARGEGRLLPPEVRPFWEFGVATCGPALTGFAEWVHEQAQQAGASNVLCFMREGAVLSQLVNQAGAYVEEHVTAEPLWLSRQVLARAAIATGDADELSSLLVRRSAPTVSSLLRTLDIDPGHAPQFADRGAASLADPQLRDEVLEALTSDPVLRTQLLATAAQARGRVMRLVERHRVADEPLVLVDLGWQATAQGLLDRILRLEGSDLATVGLYLLTHAGAIDRQLEGTDVRGFLGQSGAPRDAVSAIIRSPEVLEQVCMPDHGSQVDLTHELEPVLAPTADEGAFQPAERRAVQLGLQAFQAEWARYQASSATPLPRLTRGAAPLLRAHLVRAVVAPTGAEARAFGAWLHDENFGSLDSHEVASGDHVRAVRHLDPRTLIDLPMQELYWPHGLAALHDEHLARAAELVSVGQVDWEAFGSRLETGDPEVFVDTGWGFSPRGMVKLPGRRNRFGLSFVQTRIVQPEPMRALRFDPARSPCLVRLDWITLRLRRPGDADATTITLQQPHELSTIRLEGLSWVAPGVLYGAGNDPQMHVDLRELAGGDVYDVELQCAMAVLPVSPGTDAGSAVASDALRRKVRRLELRTGIPVTPAYRLAGTAKHRLQRRVAARRQA